MPQDLLSKIVSDVFGGLIAPALESGNLTPVNVSIEGNELAPIPDMPPGINGEKHYIQRMMEDVQRALQKPIEQRKWGMVIDLRKCTGCNGCNIACVTENKLPPGISYRPVMTETHGTFPNVSRRFVPRPCMQCEEPPCVDVCPVNATWKRPDGIVAIDTELVKSDKGGKVKGEDFVKREVTRKINGHDVTGKIEELQMDYYGDWPAAWDDVVGDYPRRFLEGVTLRYGPFRGHKYPIKAFFMRTGNPVITGSNTAHWIEALTAKDGADYRVELVVYIDTPFLQTGLYADVILPEASYLERMSLSDIYPSHQVIYLRDFVIDKLHESKTQYDIMIALAKKLHEKGDPDIKPEDFWEKFPTEEDFWNEALKVAPGRAHAGVPLPYPKYPVNYKLIGTPESLESGKATVDDEKKVVQGEYVTAQWLREHNGVAIWPMSWHRFNNGGVLKTASKKVEFVWDYEVEKDGEKKRQGQYSKYNKLIEAAGEAPFAIAKLGWKKYAPTFYWFETIWNPYTNPDYAKYKDEYPFQVICARVHHAMSGTQLVDWLGRIPTEDLWAPLNDERVVDEIVIGENGPTPSGRKVRLAKGSWCIGVIQMNASDGRKLGLKTGDLVELETPLMHKTKGKVNLVETIRPGVLRVAMGAGGRFSPGLGLTYDFRDVTPNANDLTDPEGHSPIMGMPVYADIIVKVKKL